MKKPIRRYRLPPPSWRAFIFVAAVCLLLHVALLPAVRAQVFAESEVKSVFLFNLTKFVVWPAEIDNSSKQQFSIAILGTDPFGRHLDEVMMNETVGGRNTVIRRYLSKEEVQWQEIDLLFVGRELFGDLPELRQAANRFGFLTVGDGAGFCHAGGMVNLLTVGSRIKIEINLEEAKGSGFLISSQVLKLAGIVTTRMEDDL